MAKCISICSKVSPNSTHVKTAACWRRVRMCGEFARKTVLFPHGNARYAARVIEQPGDQRRFAGWGKGLSHISLGRCWADLFWPFQGGKPMFFQHNFPNSATSKLTLRGTKVSDAAKLYHYHLLNPIARLTQPS